LFFQDLNGTLRVLSLCRFHDLTPVLMRSSSSFTLLLCPVLLATACGPSEDGSSSNQQASTESTEKAAWSYDGETGPEHWAPLSSDYAACDGSQQSPIDLTDASSAEGPSLQTSYSPAEAEVTDTGHAIQANTTGGTMTIGGTTYDLQQFHVHTPSEHAVDGSRYAGEIHLVHQAGPEQLAVLALFVEEGDGENAPNPSLHDWIQGTDTTLTYDASALLPSSQSYYTYEGSLTTPPCSEIVRWVVLDTPIQASSAQLDTLRAQYDGNARPLQSLNDRTLRHVSAE
jgi:carbonic anhydrase